MPRNVPLLSLQQLIDDIIPPNAVHITQYAWNHMGVRMRDCLACFHPILDCDTKRGGFVSALNYAADAVGGEEEIADGGIVEVSETGGRVGKGIQERGWG